MTSNGPSVRDDSAVRAVLDDVYAAWAAGDADAFVARYAQNASAVLPGVVAAGQGGDPCDDGGCLRWPAQGLEGSP
jgi:hypothetical protein